MAGWRSQHYRQEGGRAGIDKTILDAAVDTANRTQTANPAVPPIFSLRHLAKLIGVEYGFLRAVVARRLDTPYRTFKIRKRPLPGEPQRFRRIVVPSPRLMALQRWINSNILANGQPHEASMAFTQGDNIRSAAALHCGCRWLIKIDVQNFFEAISERRAYHVFRDFGYQPLVAFELARLCTRQGRKATRRYAEKWIADYQRWPEISDYHSRFLGYLPQGAPTSPQLANLAVRDLDTAVFDIAERGGLVYTRYADDIALSTNAKGFNRADAGRIVSQVYDALTQSGLTPNLAKTAIRTPRCRKVVLGLLVDGPEPRLQKAYKRRLERHLHFLRHPDVGPARHAAHLGGATVHGLQQHVHGLILYARQIEPAYGAERLEDYSAVQWA